MLFFRTAIINQMASNVEYVNSGFVGGIFDVRLIKSDFISIYRHLISNSLRLI